MKIASTNIGNKREVIWNEKTILTGIFKYPISDPIYLGESDVLGDNVVDRKYHGGIDKACYSYSAEHYRYWEVIYPDVDLTYGAFGENLTIEGLDEVLIRIGDQFKIGNEVIVEVAQPRQPCFKLGIRFNDQKIIKRFMNDSYSGIYFRIIKEGNVKTGDDVSLLKSTSTNLSVAEVHSLLGEKKNLELAKKAILMSELADSYKQDIARTYKL